MKFPLFALVVVALLGPSFAYAEKERLTTDQMVELGWQAWIGGDRQKAMTLYRAAAELGDPNGETALGAMYENGDSVPQDFDEALKWYRRAAARGDASGLNSLAHMYANGLGVSRDYAEARRLYKEAADKGYGIAASSLGMMYYNGIGVPRDVQEASVWFRRAAKLGDTSNRGLVCDPAKEKLYVALKRAKEAGKTVEIDQVVDKVVSEIEPDCVDEMNTIRRYLKDISQAKSPLRE